MASSIFGEKRTRSQLTIPDNLFQLPQGSPFKDARIALKNNLNSASPRDMIDEVVEETDDELLLSPLKAVPKVRTTKRSVSPSPEGEYARPESPSFGRETKRQRRDEDDNPKSKGGRSTEDGASVLVRSTHSRSLSQPEMAKKGTRKRSGTNSGTTTPSPTKPDSSTGIQSAKGRAQSVPLFPSSSSSNILHIDLRNPPPSPRRPRSRSPSKERELRIMSGPSITKLDTIIDESALCMNVEEDIAEASSARAPQNTLDNTAILPNTVTCSIDASGQSTLSKLPPPTEAVAIIHEPWTPDTEHAQLSPMSPLTPLPETPHPSKFNTNVGDRFMGIQWGSDINEEDEVSIPPQNLLKISEHPSKDKPITVPETEPLPYLKVTETRSSQSSSSADIGPMVASSSSTATKVHTTPNAAKKLTAPRSSKPAATATTGKHNAFTFMMANARENQEKDKAKTKGKGMAASSRAKSSIGGTSKTASGSKVAQKSEKIIRKEPPAAQATSLRSKMKPKPKPKPKPVSVPIVSDHDLEDRPPLSPRPLSPAHAFPRSRPSTPPIADVSMESITPALVADIPAALPKSLPSIELVIPSPIDSRASPEVIPESPQDERIPSPSKAVSLLNSVPHIETNQSLPDESIPPPAPHNIQDSTAPTAEHIVEELSTTKQSATTVQGPTKLTRTKSTTKLHISKRAPVIAPGNRITRSTSLRRNPGVPEVLKVLPNKSPGKALQPRKSVPSIEMMPSGSSTKLDEDTAYDTMASTSSLSDLPPEYSEPALPSGSPMKLDSPTKRTSKIPASSFARPTQSTAAKALSKSPVKPKPSNYRSITGSSLSNLSSALEKLHQPPPGRPNTSMGFNRDEPDNHLELKSTSQDDSAIVSLSGSGGENSTKEPSSKARVGSSHLVQRTLISGPRSSITGKSIFGNGTLMRGPGSFKVPGSSVKLGSRSIFGVGGAFSGATRARTLQKASRKTSLPSVMASPVKGGDTGDDIMDVGGDLDLHAGRLTIAADGLADQEVPLNDKGKGKDRTTDSRESTASRRVSLASKALSQSLSEKPKDSPGSMGPPATPKHKGRSTSSTYPSSKATTSPVGDPERSSPSTRSMSRGAVTGASSAAASRVPEGLKVLKDCVIFVDVRTDDGDEAGSLFVEMLQGVGARILTRVGQTCTHIVFKNGLMSTLNRYRLLRDPKPLVVGIAWVVECVEQRKRVDETKFLIDLDGVNVSGTNKVKFDLFDDLPI
ncbi:hypothetical protein H0H81_012588 [Sphagnurus paluster]|uniref:BRCT domain-containing protein n=1 Tax=Sphagnurus paluster TaxID=117069 RepID=A0A9P7GU80_9AGAR|nr:hypothetical protein H0H81_012588 [Sphagnurus paluster]